MAFNRESVRRRLQGFDFKGLFIEELGWDHYHGSPISIEVNEESYSLERIAEKRGVGVFLCREIPDNATRRKIEHQLTKQIREHLIIYTDPEQTIQKWQWVRRESGKPLACREHEFQKGQSGEAMVQRLEALYVPFEEEEETTTTAVTARTRRAFDVERVTKAFYKRFQDEHKAFLGFINGITEQGDKEWYASVMLNRLMFCYFIQKKGYLDGDTDYLRNRMQTVRKQHGGDKFYSFYRYFLLRLFHEGLGDDQHDAALEALIGKVPYLNGGLFASHPIEENHSGIDIGDDAFERVFDFFDQYRWHLDDRPLRSDSEINPDVLGYIFEKYINQKQMGAYYTKEDITEYISRSTLVPFLFDAARKTCPIAFRPESHMWRLLKEDPDRYIFDAVRHGAEHELPENIAVGLHDVSKRGDWNTPAPPEYALPTEIWREVVARRKRYEEVRGKLAQGEVTSINDFITLNLDMRQFAEDVIANCEGPELLRAFWKSINKVTVLDPTCGSGAFLFAALNILEPLYETCLERMQGFLEDLERSTEKNRPEKFSDFRKVQAEMEKHPNRRYFIYKSIILNNLYGVDIMEEATEIAKLRLFLKLASLTERDESKPNMGLEPLPDIDFNIRSGNTLVGFANLKDVRKAMQNTAQGQGRLMFGEDQEALRAIEEEAEIADRAFRQFRLQQSELGGKVTAADKLALRHKLDTLEEKLNRLLANEYGIQASELTHEGKYQAWKASHQPFHWCVDFYGIMKIGGFDVIIGNPPYANIPKNLSRQLLRSSFVSALDRWSRDEDIYTLVIERSIELLDVKSGMGLILPLSIAFSTKKPFARLREFLFNQLGLLWCSHFDRIPSALFGNEVRTRNSIILCRQKANVQSIGCYTSPLVRWEAENRDNLFATLTYSKIATSILNDIPKVGSQLQAETLRRLMEEYRPLSINLVNSISYSQLASAAPYFPQPCVYVGGTAYNWFPAWREIPETITENGKPSLPARTIGFKFDSEEDADLVFSLLCSSLGYWWWAVASDGFNLKRWLLERFPLNMNSINAEGKKVLSDLGRELRQKLRKNYVYKDNKGQIGNFFLPACSNVLREIDDALVISVDELSNEFMSDIRSFNESFSRAGYK